MVPKLYHQGYSPGVAPLLHWYCNVVSCRPEIHGTEIVPVVCCTSTAPVLYRNCTGVGILCGICRITGHLHHHFGAKSVQSGDSVQIRYTPATSVGQNGQ